MDEMKALGWFRACQKSHVPQGRGSQRALLGKISALVLAVCTYACSDSRQEQTVEQSRQALASETFELAVELPVESPIDSLALAASDGLLISQNSSVVGTSGEGAPIVNTGSRPTDILQASHVGSIVSIGSVRLKQRTLVEGSITTSGTVSNKNARVLGSVSTNANIPLERVVIEPVSVPAQVAPPIVVLSGQTEQLDPGAYESASVRAGGALELAGGRYYFGTLALDEGSDLRADDGAGPVAVYITERFESRATVSGPSGASPALLFGYFGKERVDVAGVFQGTLVAADADVQVYRASTDPDGRSRQSPRREPRRSILFATPAAAATHELGACGLHLGRFPSRAVGDADIDVRHQGR